MKPAERHGVGVLSFLVTVVLLALAGLTMTNHLIGSARGPSTDEARLALRTAAKIHQEAGRQIEQVLDTELRK